MFTGNMDHMRSWWKEEHCPYCLSFLIRRIYFIVSIKISSLSYTSLNFWTLSVVIKQNSNKPRTIIVAAERQKSDLCPNQAATQQTKGLCECVYVIYIEHLHPSVSSSHSSLCAPLPLRLTSSSTAATTIFVSRTSSSLPACKTRRHPLTWTSKHPTLQTAKRRHPRTHTAKPKQLCLLFLTQCAKFTLKLLTLWPRLPRSVCLWVCSCACCICELTYSPQCFQLFDISMAALCKHPVSIYWLINTHTRVLVGLLLGSEVLHSLQLMRLHMSSPENY